MSLGDYFLGPSIRRIRNTLPGANKKLYLSFDDGPDPVSTPRVLALLSKLNIQATFFVIAEKACAQGPLFSAIRAGGHSVGNHSLDHGYRPFFQGRKRMLAWVRESQELLTQLLDEPPVGFRPPAGVRTPELGWALKKLDIPLVLWDLRFYDTAIPWTRSRALEGLERARPGSIILLHDSREFESLPLFLDTLEFFIEVARKKGFEFAKLRKENLPS